MDQGDHVQLGDSGNERQKRPQAEIDEGLSALVGHLQSLADKQVSKKVSIETRWLEDLRQFHGKYDATTESNLKEENKSRVFVNLTRSKTNALEARLSDMLFPTTDIKNWGVKPTPNPTMPEAVQQPDQQQDVQKIAKERASNMESEIEDQLKQARYYIKCRASLHEGCVLGTGVMKGPVVHSNLRRQWKNVIAADGSQSHELVQVEDTAPGMEHVDPWSYFPDMDARRPDEKQFDFERHLMNKKKIRKLAKRPGFIKKNIRQLLNENSPENLPTYISQLEAITGSGDLADSRYQVWEYQGPLDRESLVLILESQGKDEELKEFLEDPLEEVQAVVWFCQGHLLKFGMGLMDSGESLYSIFNLETDDSSLFGFGVPYLMRDSQKALNAAWRMIMDNSGLSVGPQIVINRSKVEPADGVWEVVADKIWWAKDTGKVPINHMFDTFKIDGAQTELINVIELAQKFADDETNLPILAQGEPGAHTTTTSSGMAMMLNNVNVVFRRVVKNFDDDMTTPNIRRMYDYNMQFSDKEEIKGDFDVDARGSSVLLVREIQAQNLMAIALQFSNHPTFGPLTKQAALYRTLIKANTLSPDEIVFTEDEIKENERQAQEAAEQGLTPPDPETVRNKVKFDIARLDSDTRLRVAELEHDSAMIKLQTAQQSNADSNDAKVYMEQVRSESKERIAALGVDSKERVFAGEAALKQQHGTGI